MKTSATDLASARGLDRAPLHRLLTSSLVLAAMSALAVGQVSAPAAGQATGAPSSAPNSSSGGALPNPANTPTSPERTAKPAPTAAAQDSTPRANPAREADTAKFLRYVRAGASGARIRNIYDAQGVVVLDAKPQELLAVYSERAGWLEVETPGGFSVWVFGEYLAPAAEAGVLQVTGEGVLMRPMPSSGPESLPLRQRLGRGEKLRLIGRRDLSKPMAEDWVNVWSPPRSRAWVATTETEALPQGMDGAKSWAEAVAAIRASASSTQPAIEASAGGANRDLRAESSAIDEGERLLAQARATEQAGGVPDYASAKAAFQRVLEAAKTGPAADLAQQRIKLCATYEEAYNLTVELAQHEAARAEAMRKREQALARAENSDVFDGRFDARGWVERLEIKGEQQPVYLLRFGGSSTAELVCTSGRLRIEDFLDVEVGVSGRELRGAIVGPTSALSRPREIDVSRLEVISARRTK